MLNGFCNIQATADTSAPPAPFFLTILDRSSLRRRLMTAYGSSVLRRWQRHTATAASFDDGSVLRRRQHRTTTAGDGSGTTKATAARPRRQRFVSTADNGTSYEDNGSAYIGERRRQRPTSTTTPSAAASVSSADRNNNQPTTGVRRRRRQYNDRWGMGEERYNNQP